MALLLEVGVSRLTQSTASRHRIAKTHSQIAHFPMFTRGNDWNTTCFFQYAVGDRLENRWPAGQGGILKIYLASLVVALGCLLAGASAYAQQVDQIEADIPFPFHAGIAKFPAGKYTFHVTEIAEISTMEVQSADGQSSALLEIRNVQAQQPSKTTELIFTQYGGRYFLLRILDMGDKYSRTLVDIGYLKKYDAALNSGKALHVPAHRSFD
jgi:hypothetical protein